MPFLVFLTTALWYCFTPVVVVIIVCCLSQHHRKMLVHRRDRVDCCDDLDDKIPTPRTDQFNGEH